MSATSRDWCPAVSSERSAKQNDMGLLRTATPNVGTGPRLDIDALIHRLGEGHVYINDTRLASVLVGRRCHQEGGADHRDRQHVAGTMQGVVRFTCPSSADVRAAAGWNQSAAALVQYGLRSAFSPLVALRRLLARCFHQVCRRAFAFRTSVRQPWSYAALGEIIRRASHWMRLCPRSS